MKLLFYYFHSEQYSLWFALKARASILLPAMDGHCPGSPRTCGGSEAALQYKQCKISYNYLNSHFFFTHLKNKYISDAAVEHSVPTFAPGTAASSPGPWGDDNGLHLARRREKHSCGRFVFHILHLTCQLLDCFAVNYCIYSDGKMSRMLWEWLCWALPDLKCSYQGNMTSLIWITLDTSPLRSLFVYSTFILWSLWLNYFSKEDVVKRLNCCRTMVKAI